MPKKKIVFVKIKMLSSVSKFHSENKPFSLWLLVMKRDIYSMYLCMQLKFVIFI